MSKIINITDFNDKELDVYARLSEGELLNRAEPDKGIFIAESPKVIERAIKSGCEVISFLMEEKHIEGEGRYILEMSPEAPVFTAPFDVLTQLTGFKLTRGMLAAMKRPVLRSVEDIVKDARRIAILEEVENPTNLGAIIRSAAALGIDAVLLTKGCTNPLYRRAARVSMGTVFQIPWTFIEDEWPAAGIEKLKSLGFKLASMALREDSTRIDDEKLLKEEKLAIVLGTEGDGLKDETIDASDYTVMIPMAHGVDSLNVAAASAVAFYGICRE